MTMMVEILKDAAGQAPAEFQVLPMGRVELEGEEPVTVDADSIASILAHFARRGNDLVIDYEHQSLGEGQAPAAGWVKQLLDRGADGLWAVVEWTARAREYLQAREYRYYSPVFGIDKRRHVRRLYNIGLTNSPKLNQLRPIAARLDRDGAEPEEDEMDQQIKEMLGLAADAPEAEVVKALRLMIDQAAKQAPGQVVACKEVYDALGITGDVATVDQVVARIDALKAPADAAVQLSRDVAELRTEIARMKSEDMISAALKDGKTSPEEIDSWGRDLAARSPEQFRLIVLSRPAGSVIPVGDLPKGAPDKKAGGLGDPQVMINKMMGISDDTWAKYGPQEDAI